MATLLEKIRNGALIVDVRTVYEFEDEHFPGAINIPVNDLLPRMSELGEDKERPIILYCASGARSAYAAMILKSHGYKDVTNAGGLDDLLEIAGE